MAFRATNILQPFRPPFIGLAPLVWLYFIACYLLFPNSYVLRGAFIESDNYTYLAQMLDWLNGQGWYDNIQHRLAPPDGTFIHFSRLAELPIAALTLPLHFVLPWRGAATLAAMIEPPLLLWALFWSARWVAESFMPREWTRITAFTILFSEALLFQFSLGHVGHRAPALILVLLAFSCINRMMMQPTTRRWALWGGFLVSFALAMALETLLWILVLTAWVGIWMIVKGRETARAGVIFSVTALLASLFFLSIYKPPAQWLQPEILSFSITYIMLIACVAICCCGVALASLSRITSLRYLVGLALVTITGGLFLHHFPELIAGPYGGMNPDLAKIFFTYIPESKPLRDSMPLWALAVSLSEVGLGLGASLFFLARTKNDTRWLHGLATVLLASAILLTAFYQARFFRYANLFALIPLALLLQQGWNRTRHPAVRIALVVLVGPLLTVFIPAIIGGHLFTAQTLMFPMRDVRSACDLQPVERLLQSAKKPLLIMNTMSTGPEILFRTQHKTMAAPYHYNVRGNKESIAFFGATRPEQAEAIALIDHVDAVLLCDMAIDIYHLDATAPSFFDQLRQHQIPAWLHEVDLPPGSGFQLFEVKP